MPEGSNAVVGGIAADLLRTYVDNIETLEAEKAETAGEIKEAYRAAGNAGFDPKIIRAIIKERKISENKRRETDMLMDTYRHALGMLRDTPLGQAAVVRLATGN